MPFFSVIIPTFNRANILPRAIESILSQSFSDWELIIQDDGSTDETSTIVQSFLDDRRIKYFSEENQGVCAARNLGSEKAIADWGYDLKYDFKSTFTNYLIPKIKERYK